MDSFIDVDVNLDGSIFSAGRRESDVNKAIQRQFTLAAEFFISEVRLATPVGATNNLRDSWDFGYIKSSQRVVIAPRSEYAMAVEMGRRPGKWIPIEPLQLWVKRKLGVDNEREAKSIAFAISRKAKMSGIRGKFFVSKTFEATLPTIQSAFISPLGNMIVRALRGSGGI